MKNNNRWWESYLTRYLIGTIVGALCIFYLVEYAKEANELVCLFKKLLGNIDEGDSKGVYILTLGAMGFAYCYLISAPLTLIHHLRLSQWPGKTDTNQPISPPSRAFRVIYALFWVLSILGFLLIGRPAPLPNAGCPPSGISISCGALWIIAVGFLVLFAIVSYCTRNFGKIAYENSKTLSKQLPSGKIDKGTYKALSEHGNAYSIVILQVLATIFIHNCKNNTTLLMVFLLWIALGALCWFIAKRIEYYYVEKLK
jgi:hypothetical protein